MTTRYRGLPVDGSSPRDIAAVVNSLRQGKMNCVGSVTLTESTTTTTVADIRVTADSVIVLTPMTADAAAEVAAGGLYVSARTAGTSFQLTHASAASEDRVFAFAILA